MSEDGSWRMKKQLKTAADSPLMTLAHMKWRKQPRSRERLFFIGTTGRLNGAFCGSMLWNRYDVACWTWGGREGILLYCSSACVS